jgi:hypothetical protein
LKEKQFLMSELTCPKCGGTDYFFSKRNVITGIGGVWGNRGGVKQFPVCKVCDEIMSEPHKWDHQPITTNSGSSGVSPWWIVLGLIFIAVIVSIFA